jgi:ribosome-binding factor A
MATGRPDRDQARLGEVCVSRNAQRGFDRGERIGAALLRELTQLLRRAKDPRLGEITLHEVRVSRDLAHAKVFFTCFPTDEDAHAQQQLLNGSLAGFLRHELARNARLRTVPQLHFVHDESVQRGERLSALIEAAVGNETGAGEQDPTTNGGTDHWGDEAETASGPGR